MSSTPVVCAACGLLLPPGAGLLVRDRRTGRVFAVHRPSLRSPSDRWTPCFAIAVGGVGVHDLLGPDAPASARSRGPEEPG